MIVTSNKFNYELSLPTSKSYAARALVLASLKAQKIIVSDIPSSSDTKELIEVLRVLGLAQTLDNKVVINKSFPLDEIKINKTIELNLGEGGTTIRFLLPFLALGINKYKIKVHPRFKKRPYKDYLSLLESFGAYVELDEREDILCTIQGPLSLPELIEVDCTKTTQEASAFLMIASVMNKKVITKNLFASRTYYKMTEYLCENLTDNYNIPVDMSGASYFLALGAVFQEVHIKNLFGEDKFQADSIFISLLRKIGADISFDPYLKIKPVKQLTAFHIDGSHCIDLVPTLAFIASYCSGESKISNIENLKYKESNRLEGICNILESFNIKFKVENETLFVLGTKERKNNKRIEPFIDHRMVMLSSLFLKVSGGGEVEHAEVVKKSFPEFFTLLN